ncbi:Stringent starvation protein B [uncultured Caudovirales phage]|uniref:Stringent starvation protein B n=1 Tax=uncultured Caudovirales phage TaxID=2100421 RepID=A0A6J5NMQ6_9CAUD|nr:Stringent starvation protein B [uncultured Caudovirales phage]
MSIINVKELLENYLAEGKILIAVNSYVEGVVLPEHLMNSIQVKLNLSYHFATSIFEINEEEVRIDLSFSGSRFLCVMPLTSIYYVAMAEDPLNGVEVIDNMPIELLELSYQLEMQTEKYKETDENEINFLEFLPKEKFDEVSDDKSVNLSKKEFREKSFDEFMRLVSDYEIQEKLREISSKMHSSRRDDNALLDNEINFTDYVNNLKNQKQ